MAHATASRISPAFDDPEAVLALVRAAGPFWPLANYAANDAEMSALGSRRNTFTPPWFRQDFATEGSARVPGAETILHNGYFVDAARAITGPDSVVHPTHVYVNIMGPTSFPFMPHLDVPAFRGFTRADHPIWLLKLMKASGLFERWRTKIVTAVSWFYAGPGGDFHYWPDGPDGAHVVESPPFENVSVVADNEATFHGVAPLGPAGATMPGDLTRESRLVRGDGGWEAQAPDGSTLTRFADADVRVTVSWKADVFTDPADEQQVTSSEDLLDLTTVVDTFDADLQRRGVTMARPQEPLADQEWIGTLAATYPEPAPAIG